MLIFARVLLEIAGPGQVSHVEEYPHEHVAGQVAHVELGVCVPGEGRHDVQVGRILIEPVERVHEVEDVLGVADRTE